MSSEPLIQLVRKCANCTRVDDEYSLDDPYCEFCRQLLVESVRRGKEQAWADLKAKYDQHVVAQVQVMNLLQFINERQPEQFETWLGTQGMDLFNKALGAVETTS